MTALKGAVNYVEDVGSYSITNEKIKRNVGPLFKAYEDIIGLRIYFDC